MFSYGLAIAGLGKNCQRLPLVNCEKNCEPGCFFSQLFSFAELTSIDIGVIFNSAR
jgi:hypothetical protein